MKFTINIEDRLTPKLQQLEKLSPEMADKALRKLAFDLMKRILEKSPIDTGRFRAGWHKGVEGVNKGAGGDLEISYDSPNANPNAIEQGKTEGRYREFKESKYKKIIEIVNAVRYGIFLEYGWSGQSPTGLVRISISEEKSVAKEIFRREFFESLREFWKNPKYRGRALGHLVEETLGHYPTGI